MSDVEQDLSAGSVDSSASKAYLDNDRVNDLIRANKAEASEKAYAKASDEFEARTKVLLKEAQEAWKRDLDNQKQQEQELRQANEQQEQAKATQQYADKVIKSVASKIEEAKEDIPDFDETVNKVSIFNQYPMLLVYADQVENTVEVLYELAKNPSKVKKVLDAGNDGLVEISNLSNSIKTNKAAKSQKSPGQPVKHIKSSTTAMSNGDLGTMSAADLAAYFR